MSDNDTPTPDAQAASGTGQGGPQAIDRVQDERASASRPQRATHVEGEPVSRRTDEAAPTRAIVRKAQRRRAQRMAVTRRQLLRVSFWGALGFGLTGGLGAFLTMFWPRGLQGFGGKIPISASVVPEPGDEPVRVANGKFWLTHLRPGEGTHAGFGQPGDGGLMALWWKCPHLGCTVPWLPSYSFEGVTGWFRCPCHGSTYSRAGIRVFGPAPRPLDTFSIAVNADGSLSVDTGNSTKGGDDNPQRAVPYSG